MRNRTYKPGTHINLKNDEFEGFTKFTNKVWPYAVGILAAYGFIDIMLTANGL
jgi:nitrate reductase NapE component